MKRILFVSSLLFVALCLFSQSKRGLRGTTLDTDSFPSISFVWNVADPNVLDKSQFVITEDNNNVDFQFSVLDNTGKYSKSILFLWEDMASHADGNNNQSHFTRYLLENFLKNANLSAQDKFNVAVFNRKKNGEDILHPFLPEFTSNKEKLLDNIGAYRTSTEFFDSHIQETDLYSAITDGIRLLKNETTDYQVLIVITAGKNMSASGANTEMAPVRREAAVADIPIYAIKFPIGGDTPNLDLLCDGSFGYAILFKSYDGTLADLNKLYEDLDTRCYGHDYRITFKTNAEMDGNVHQVGFSVGKVSQDNLTFTAPSKTFAMWIVDNLILFISLVVTFVVIVVIVVIFVRKRVAKRQKEIAENKAALENKIMISNQNYENLKQQHEQEKNARVAAEQRKRMEEESERLVNVMRVKNLYPRLQCNVSGSMFSYSISKPVTKVGRNEANDLVLAHMTVSSFHAEIIFDGFSFVLYNRSNTYKQGIIVNGQFYQQCALRNGDIIGFGEAVVTFYI